MGFSCSPLTDHPTRKRCGVPMPKCTISCRLAYLLHCINATIINQRCLTGTRGNKTTVMCKQYHRNALNPLLGWNYIGANAKAKVSLIFAATQYKQTIRNTTYPFQAMSLSLSLSLQYNSTIKRSEQWAVCSVNISSQYNCNYRPIPRKSLWIGIWTCVCLCVCELVIKHRKQCSVMVTAKQGDSVQFSTKPINLLHFFCWFI